MEDGVWMENGNIASGGHGSRRIPLPMNGYPGLFETCMSGYLGLFETCVTKFVQIWVYFFDLFIVWYGFLDLFLVFLDLME